MSGAIMIFPTSCNDLERRTKMLPTPPRLSSCSFFPCGRSEVPLSWRSGAWHGGQPWALQRRGRGGDQVQESLHDCRRAFVGLPGRRHLVEASPQVCVPTAGVNHHFSLCTHPTHLTHSSNLCCAVEQCSSNFPILRSTFILCISPTIHLQTP